MTIVLLAYSISFLLGYIFIGLVFDNKHSSDIYNDSVLRLLFALPIGMGISSLLSFYAFVVFAKAERLAFFVIHFSVLLMLIFLRAFRKNKICFRGNIITRMQGWQGRFIMFLFMLYVLFLFTAFFFTLPYGSWDAASCWNLRAKFLMVSDNWLKAFSPTMTAVNYPILLPLNIAWGWIANGSDTVIVPIFIALAYTLATVLIIFKTMERFHGAVRALLGTVFLFSIPAFILNSVNQYADIVLSCYNVIGILCFFIGLKEKREDYMLLGQLALGFSAFTKLEGILYVIGLNLFMLLYCWFKNRGLAKSWLKSLLFVAGPLMTLAVFNHLVSAPQKGFFTSGIPFSLVLSKIKIFLWFFAQNILLLRSWALFWLAFLVFLLFFAREIFMGVRAFISFTVGFVLIVYFIIFILKIEPPIDNLNYAFDRFIIHVLPLLCFLIVDVIFHKPEAE